MERIGTGPDVYSYNQMIKGFDGSIGKAYKLFEEMGIDSDVISYNALINGFCKSDRVNDAVHLYEEMQSNGLSPMRQLSN
ncbi:hypothetical protein F3Y22_tig00110114pilonHSYRG00330 [Hibiscus syriacus]|uniref:Pentatricopeptide repeat-containing protein n=1 Tax=Hibiscus syriacus TaxID=106335 RepID=A0A6A3BIT4_HIBSY|nr:hypothetical protein F3Y22_tig00110114pilonHSYRG00330 [Hibiscus syriacus]